MGPGFENVYKQLRLEITFYTSGWLFDHRHELCATSSVGNALVSILYSVHQKWFSPRICSCDKCVWYSVAKGCLESGG